VGDRFIVAGTLREIALLMEAEGGNPFKVRAYERGAKAIEALAEDPEVLIREGRLTRVPGIGAALASTIEEIVRTGRSGLRETLRERLPAGVLELSPVLSLPRIATLDRELGIRTLAELEAACEAGRVREVKGFGPKTEAKILADIRALADRGDETLLFRAVPEADALLDYARRGAGVVAADVAGEVRRRVEAVSRLDVALAGRDAEAVIDHVARYPAAAAVLQRGPGEVLLRLAGGLNVKAVAGEASRHAWTVLRLTGSEGHLAKLAVVAEARGLQWTDDGLRKGGTLLPADSEADVYRDLGLPFVPPEMRDDAGEVEAAVRGTLPAPLLALEDVRGMVHCHTHYSDGKHSVEEMARGADALGMRYLTITDHSPTASYAGGLTLDRLHRQWDDIARAQEKVKVRLLRGTESDILADGSLDYPDAVLDQLDVVIASVHNRHRMDAAQMTRRIVTAMRHPRFKIWGHALGRYVLTRPPFAVHMEEILDVVAESRAAVEVNGDPHRLDMEPRWIREARTRGIRFVVSTDAHSVNAMRNLRWGVDMARRGWLTRDEVLNTRDVDAFRAAVKP
jgi:DNA polymerase (family 10)